MATKVEKALTNFYKSMVALKAASDEDGGDLALTIQFEKYGTDVTGFYDALALAELIVTQSKQELIMMVAEKSGERKALMGMMGIQEHDEE